MYYSQNSRPGSNYGRRRPTYNRSQPSSRGKNRKENIHPSRYIKAAKPVETVDYIPIHEFLDFEVNSLIKDNLKGKGFLKPSPIQDQTIPLGLEGKDIVGIADTGTGKTAAFAIPLLHQLMESNDTYALIMAPTRELAEQIEEQCKSIAKGSGLRGVLLIGGVAMWPQLRDLKFNPRIVIGTPGRIKDHVEQGTLQLSKFNMIVLDEVDRMLDMGFINDITHILSRTAEKRQSFFFSATLDPKVRTIIDKFAVDPSFIAITSSGSSENVEQNIITYNSSSEKVDKLHNLLMEDSVVKTLVFDDTHRSVERLCKELQARGLNADTIHGGKSQSQRQRALKRFKDSQIKILVATDVAARGIDVSDITHVINFSAPNSYSDYIHRIGRTGRAGRMGHALTFVQK
jgi:ATP-dependent RNA helicase RhlE